MEWPLPSFRVLSNGQIVWVAYDGHDEEIFFFDGLEIIQLTNNDENDNTPSIDNGQIVWLGNGYESDLFYYDGSNIHQITDSGYLQHGPEISNGIISWYAKDIFLYDGTRVKQITDNNLNNQGLKNHEGDLVWYSNPSKLQIFMRKFSVTAQITNNQYYNQDPVIHSGMAAWIGVGHPTSDAFLFDGTNVIQLSDDATGDGIIRICNGRVAWIKMYEDDWEIFVAYPKLIE